MDVNYGVKEGSRVNGLYAMVQKGGQTLQTETFVSPIFLTSGDYDLIGGRDEVSYPLTLQDLKNTRHEIIFQSTGSTDSEVLGYVLYRQGTGVGFLLQTFASDRLETNGLLKSSGAVQKTNFGYQPNKEYNITITIDDQNLAKVFVNGAYLYEVVLDKVVNPTNINRANLRVIGNTEFKTTIKSYKVSSDWTFLPEDVNDPADLYY